MRTTFRATAAILAILLSLVPQTTTAAPAVNGHLVGVTGLSSNWTGYEVTSGDNANNYYSQVEATWTVHEPTTVISGTDTVLSEITTWVGLGGDTSNEPKSSVLWQAGTTNWNNRYEFWYEDWGCVNPCPQNGNPVSVDYPTLNYGDRVKVVVKLDGSVTFSNLTSKQEKTYQVAIDNNHVGLSAEWISELTCTAVLDSGCVPIKFSNPHFADVYAYGNKTSAYFDAMNYARFDLGDADNNKITKPTVPVHHGFNVSCCMSGRH